MDIPNKEEIFEKVRKCLVEALDVDEEDVSLEASLTEDLEAESIDFVDIVFRLEKAFSIKIPQGELFPQDVFSNKQYVASGKLTAAGVQILRDRYPYLRLPANATNMPVSDLASHYNVEMLVRYVTHKLTS
jgi:acyl carrier protein